MRRRGNRVFSNKQGEKALRYFNPMDEKPRIDLSENEAIKRKKKRQAQKKSRKKNRK